MHENRHFLLYRKNVAMTLKIVCTYAQYVTLGSRCKMASSHRITDLEKIPVQISLSVLAQLFISSLLFHLSRTLLGVYFLLVISSFSNVVRCVAFQSFLFCLLELSQQARLHQGACLLLGVLFYFPNLSLFAYVKMKRFGPF